MVTIGLKRIKSNMFLNFIILGTLKSARKAHGFNSTCSFLRFYSPVDTLPSEYCKIWGLWRTSSTASKYTGCHRRNGPNFGRMFLML